MENFLFDLKIKELQALKQKFEIHDDILILHQDKQIVALGCRLCYMKKPNSNMNGFEIEGGELINYYEKYKEDCTVPVEIAINCWLCPKCGRLFKELLPEMEILEIKNVSL